MADSYVKVTKGKLKIGGVEIKSKKKKKKKSSHKDKGKDKYRNDEDDDDVNSSNNNKKRKYKGDDDEEEEDDDDYNNKKKLPVIPTVEVINGTGRIMSSGSTIQGKETKFMEELSIGDLIQIQHPTTFMEEQRIITMVLSNVAIGISSAFSSDLISYVGFKYIKKIKLYEDEEEERKAKSLKKMKTNIEEEKNAFGTYASEGGKKMVYRVKKSGVYGGYQIITQDSSKELTREELLDKRCGMKGDRHCY